MRNYDKKYIPHEDDVVIPISDWGEANKVGFTMGNGSGYWMKDGFVSEDEVFSTLEEDATHVIWYNK